MSFGKAHEKYAVPEFRENEVSEYRKPINSDKKVYKMMRIKPEISKSALYIQKRKR